MEKEIIIASNNANKIREINQILSGKFSKIYSLKEKDIDIDVVEDSDTFFGNAYKKAKAISEITGMIALADDSGLMVDALNGAPGVYSARYAGNSCNDYDNNIKLLDALKNVENRKACFVSAIVLYFPNGSYIDVQAVVEGEILNEFKGNNGFGYDSLFYSYDLKKSFGEAEAFEKNSISHRKKALEKLLQKLNKSF